MPDKKDTYWCDWEIYGPDGDLLESLKRPVPTIEKDRLKDPDYLINLIKTYPDQTLLNEYVWRQIVMLRQKAFKNKNAVESFERVCKAIMGDGHIRKTNEKLIELKRIIRRDFKFFRTVQNKISEKKIGIDNTIQKYLAERANDGSTDDPEKDEFSNYRNTYFKYKKIYDQLEPIMSQQEIFTFFEEAREHLEDPNATVEIQPDGRHLTFVKKYTWFVEGQDMATTID
jgi:hypothetical protein